MLAGGRKPYQDQDSQRYHLSVTWGGLSLGSLRHTGHFQAQQSARMIHQVHFIVLINAAAAKCMTKGLNEVNVWLNNTKAFKSEPVGGHEYGGTCLTGCEGVIKSCHRCLLFQLFCSRSSMDYSQLGLGQTQLICCLTALTKHHCTTVGSVSH